MKIKQFRYSSDNNLAYLVYGDKTAMAIDGGAAEEILSFIETNDLTLKYVTNTHSHGKIKALQIHQPDTAHHG